MNRVVVLVLADVETKGDLGRVVNALQTTKEFRDGLILGGAFAWLYHASHRRAPLHA